MMNSRQTPRALRIVRLGLRVADLEGMRDFYADALGFRTVPHGLERAGAAPASVVMRLGDQEIELRRPVPPGAAYPRPRAANDPWFQHFAIAVGDMDAAYARLEGSGFEPISRGGPRRLPPSDGSVVAFKFRDPEGRPLELSQIPGSAWDRSPPGPGPFLGIDHTALAVRGLGASLDFYIEVLGFYAGARTLNHGEQQDGLDGLDGTRVEIATLLPADGGPHIELLRYRSPPAAAAREVGDRDIAATRTVILMETLGAVAARLDDRRWPWRWLDGAILTRDLDGHHLELIDSP